MRKVFVTVGLVLLTAIGMRASFDSDQDRQQAPPPWAYTVNPPPTPGAPPPPVDPEPKQAPGTTVTFTIAQTRDAFNPPDWHPSGHPAMPEAVAHGRRPAMRACGFCHLANGHTRESLLHPMYQRMMRNAVAWCLRQEARETSGAPPSK